MTYETYHKLYKQEYPESQLELRIDEPINGFVFVSLSSFDEGLEVPIMKGNFNRDSFLKSVTMIHKRLKASDKNGRLVVV